MLTRRIAPFLMNSLFAVCFQSSVIVVVLAETPPSLTDLQETDYNKQKKTPAETLDLRMIAQRDAAFSFGARSGLARHTWELQQKLEQTSKNLDKTFRFDALIIPQKNNFLMIPPIVIQADNAFALKDGGRLAAASDKAFRIAESARITSISPNWRDYLGREWGVAAPPPTALLPKNHTEKKWWTEHLNKGWEEGFKQASDIFQADLDLLERDFSGMVLYRELLAKKMISAPFAYLDDKGVVGGGNELLIGERTIRITGDSSLNPDPNAWIPLEEAILQDSSFSERVPLNE